MKKIFNHTKRPDLADNYWKDWEESEEGAYIEEEDIYNEAEDTYAEEEGYYAREEDAYAEEEGYYAEEEDVYAEEAEYYAGEEDTYAEEVEYHAEEEDVYAEEAEYYAGEEDTYAEEAEYHAEEEDVYAEEAEYYAGEEDTYAEEVEYYAEEEEVYAEEVEYYAEEEDAYTGEAEFYAGEEEPYSGEGEYYARKEAVYDGVGEIIYEDDDIYNVDYPEEHGRGDRDKKGKEGGWLIRKLKEMPVMDRVIVGTGVAVLVLALVTGIVLVSARRTANQVSGFVSVGTQLDGIELIGGKGLLAVADAQIARLEAASMVWNQQGPEETEPPADEKDPGYEENEYSRQVSVEMKMTSIQRDLKIKFTNEKTGKLVANVPFSVTVTDPDGKTSIWSDDDMDGIIYKKDIAAGTYKIAMEKLSDEKYAGYSISTKARSVEVKKDIDYEKVDVADEVKTEAEVDAGKEDTAHKDTVVESTLQDTVAWVESTAVGVSYIEVAKSEIVNPLDILTVARGLDKSFQRMRLQGADVILTPSSGQTIAVGSVTRLTAAEPVVTGNAGETVVSIEKTNEKWVSSSPAVAAVDNNGLVTGVGTGETVIQYTATAKVTYVENADPSVSGGDAADTSAPVEKTAEVPVSGKITIKVASGQQGVLVADKTTLGVVINGTAAVQVTAVNFTEGKKLVYQAASDKEKVAVAVIDANGKVTVTGVGAGTAVITVTANYEEGGIDETAAQTVIVVTVGANKVIELSSTATLAYVANPLTVSATVKGASATASKITVESSDTSVMKASVGTLKTENDVITAPIILEPLKEGSATLTVKCLENDEEVKAVCVVTVRQNPKEDKTTQLKDKAGNLLYVSDNGEYRQAAYADYFTYEKFYIKGDVKYTGWQTLNGHVYYYTAEGKAVTGEQVIQGAKYTFASDGTLVTGNGTMGIDVSKWNGTIDWNAVKNSGVSYVIIRCGYRGSSQGALIEDPKFQANIKGATAVGLNVGVYFFTQAVDEREAVEEASMVLGLIKNYRISYPVFLDVESSGGRGDTISKESRTAVCRAFCQTVQNAGYTAGIYANKTWLESKLDAGTLSAYKIWLAQYVEKPTYTGRYDLWQYRSTGRVSGISGDVDMNLSYLGY